MIRSEGKLPIDILTSRTKNLIMHVCYRELLSADDFEHGRQMPSLETIDNGKKGTTGEELKSPVIQVIWEILYLS